MSRQEISRRVDGIRIPLGAGPDALDRAVFALYGSRTAYHVLRRSVDARVKTRICFVYSVGTGLAPVPVGLSPLLADAPSFALRAVGGDPLVRPVVVGTGPAGMFAGLSLAMAGRRPILLEQGKDVDTRAQDVARFFAGGSLDPTSNVQFGEGGAGTFSDGKLTTGIRDPRVAAVLQELVLAGAPDEILWSSRPHVGTDRLHGVVRNIRRKIEALGGEYRFGHRFCGAGLEAERLRTVRVQLTDSGSEYEMECRQLVLAVGHSARQTLRLLAELGFAMEPKPFSVGVRIEHPQRWIDQAQYGSAAGHPDLPPAEYKLSCHLASGRSVYTFCMCPGGVVVAASSTPDGIVTNGMSSFLRDGPNANSALLVAVTSADYPDGSAMGGIAYQEKIERDAWRLAGGSHLAPSVRAGVMLGHSSAAPHETPVQRPEPSYRPGVVAIAPDTYLPGYVVDAMREALPLFGRKIRGFDHPDALLTGPETRSSSPVRLLRGADGQASVSGVYPCGEGAGYAGGIVSSAVDGIRTVQAMLHENI
ncbi:MAG: hypothetical protein GX153_00615 [Clostridiaceae bacterium]|nr:hypothetical protein [Clostridiaceae bacterium]